MLADDVAKQDNDDGIRENHNANVGQTPASKRKNYGRAARRRRRKMAEILRAEETLRRTATCCAPATASAPPKQRNVHMTAHEPNQIIPSDRHRVWPGVEERRRLIASSNKYCNDHWLDQDAALLTAQLGYTPGNAIRVAARIRHVPLLKRYCDNHSDAEDPVVLQLYPIVVRDEHLGGKTGRRKFKSRKRTHTPHDNDNDNAKNEAGTNTSSSTATTSLTIERGHAATEDASNSDHASKIQHSKHDLAEDSRVIEPFPTLYWLTHPLLRTLVSKLELQSMGCQLEQRLAKDDGALASMNRAHAAYGRERYELLTKEDLAYIQQRSWEAAVSAKRGVAGIRNYASVKCLHAHVAHYLSGGASCSDNRIGKWVMEAIADMLECDNADGTSDNKAMAVAGG